MSLPRTVTQSEFGAELGRFEALIRSVDATDWDRPSRCAGWSAGDVAKHVVGQFADVVAGRFDGLGSDEATQREVDERAGRGPAEVADELAELVPSLTALLDAFDDAMWAGPSPNGTGTLGEGVEALWSDMVLHADDVRCAVGRDVPADLDPTPAVSHIADVLTQRGWRPATIALDGLPRFDVSGGGDEITGAAVALRPRSHRQGQPRSPRPRPGINIYA